MTLFGSMKCYMFWPLRNIIYHESVLLYYFYLFAPDDDLQGSKHVAFYKDNIGFIIQDSFVD
jgi:hypothetical protein